MLLCLLLQEHITFPPQKQPVRLWKIHPVPIHCLTRTRQNQVRRASQKRHVPRKGARPKLWVKCSLRRLLGADAEETLSVEKTLCFVKTD